MSEIYADLEQTFYGQELEANVRFGTFKPDFVTNEEWCEMLGDDVNNYRHMEFTAGITAWYIEQSELLGHPFTQEEQDTLMLTAYTHDFAEAIDGDVPDPEKDTSEQAKALERFSHFAVAQYVAAEDTTDLVMDVTQGKHDLSDHFRAIEVIGYLTSGIKAGDVMMEINKWRRHFGYTGTQADILFMHLDRMNDEVVTIETARLFEKFYQLPVVNKMMKEGREAIGWVD